MKKTIFSLLVFVFFLEGLSAQKYFTRDGKISFYSDAPIEKIEANNSSATSVIDTETGKMEFAVLIKGFQFEKALMQEHFNENYMESSKYPKATFKGEIVNFKEINFEKDGTYKASVKGDMTIHGVTKPLETTGTFTVKNGAVSAATVFDLTVADFNIQIPSLVKDNIAKTVKVSLSANYQVLKSGS